MSLVRLLLGRRLATSEQGDQKIGVAAGVAALGLDSLASSAYGPEALLLVLAPLGVAGLHYVLPLTLAILVLLTVLYLSYCQTIAAYPGGGGSYVVAKENLGKNAGLWAAAALLVDYVLTVAVGISAGVGALVSAFPVLHPHTLTLCLVVLALITLVNLRGTRESGWAFAFPTYLFLACFAVVLVAGISRAVVGHGHPHAVAHTPKLHAGVAAVSVWMLMQAFASGCTAMTGVEAVSNGITAFRDPAVANARRTLTVIVGSLALLLGGIAYLCGAYGIGAMDQKHAGYQSVLSQLVGAVFGRGAFYYVAIVSLLAILCLSANTSFVGFPRLCRLLAADEFLPRRFAAVGRRLVHSSGIAFLSATAGGLLIGFGGVTDRLIPLFAVGAFLAFTLSQAGMVLHWRRQMREQHGAGPWAKIAINGIGALATGVALVVILVAKFRAGAWITVLALPLLVTLFKLIKRHYVRFAWRMRKRGRLNLRWHRPPLVVVPTEAWDHPTDKALRYAVRLSPDVIGVHLASDDDSRPEEATDALVQKWREDVEAPARRAGLTPPQLEVIRSPYRMFVEPLMKFIERIGEANPGRTLMILIPEVVLQHWWQWLLHDRRAERLRSALLRAGNHRVVVMSVPWYVEEADDDAQATEPTEDESEAAEFEVVEEVGNHEPTDRNRASL